MDLPVCVKQQQLEAFLDDGYPVLCLVTQNSKQSGLHLTVIDFVLENGIPAEISLTFSPKLKIGDPVLFRNSNGEPHVMRTEPRDESARHKLQVAREELLPGLFGN